MVGALIFLIVLNIGLIATIVYLQVSDRQPPIARFLEPTRTIDPPFTREFNADDSLNTQQRQKLLQLMKSFRSDVEPLQQEIRKLERNLFNTLLNQDEANSQEARNIIREIAQIRIKIGDHALESLQQSRNFLTLEQQRIFIHSIMSAGRERVPGPGIESPKPPFKKNKPFDNP